jgi:hypothetical protein
MAEPHHLGGDEALQQAEHPGVRAALHLAQQAPVLVVQEVQLVREREPSR